VTDVRIRPAAVMRRRTVVLCASAVALLLCAGLGVAVAGGYLPGHRRQATAAVRSYLHFVRTGDVDGAYGLLCPEIVADGTYTVADHRYYLRSRPGVGSVGRVEDVGYDTGIDGTYVTVLFVGTDAAGSPLQEQYTAGIYTTGPRVCDAIGWSEAGMALDPGPSPSPLPGR
jgi:hypothetical protein